MASVEAKPERLAVLNSAEAGVTLTIRLLMQGKEVGGIIGKKGEIVKRIREESGAIIRISDGSVPERIVTISGNTDSIIKAFDLICNKFEEDMESSPSIGSGNVPKPPITLRLIVPASQCGSLIGKGGSKIKEIREVTGASIQVASEMLPNSTERAVTVSGASEAIELCIQHICAIMIESPPKGATIPYRPKPCTSTTNTGPSMLMTAGAVPALQGNLAGITTPADVGKLLSLGLGTSLGLTQADWRMTGLMDIAANLGTLNSFRPQDHNRGSANQQTHEMTVPNELIGCIIGKGGSKISEIRQLSGAMIRISNCEDVEGGKTDRTIIISGSGDAVALAQYLINARLAMETAGLGIPTPYPYYIPAAPLPPHFLKAPTF